MTGIELIAQERKEQIEKHGRTIEQDVISNGLGQLARAASIICTEDYGCLEADDIINEWGPQDWNLSIWGKMVKKPYKERLIIAGALMAAELDRLNLIETGTPKQ